MINLHSADGGLELTIIADQQADVVGDAVRPLNPILVNGTIRPFALQSKLAPGGDVFFEPAFSARTVNGVELGEIQFVNRIALVDIEAERDGHRWRPITAQTHSDQRWVIAVLLSKARE